MAVAEQRTATPPAIANTVGSLHRLDGPAARGGRVTLGPMALSEDKVKKIYAQPNWYKPANSVLGVAKTLPRYLVVRALNGRGGIPRHILPKLPVKRGDSMLVLCCGPFSQLDWVPERLGHDARILGIDFSPILLEEARPQVQKLGLTNVELKEADASKDLGTDEQFDLSLCMFGISVIPNWEGAYENLVKHTKVGGKVALRDMALREGWRSKLDPLIVWGTEKYGGTLEGIGNVNRFAERIQKDARFSDANVTFAGHTCNIVATRRA
jgi:ubiquinone/menaquinone biosynthesis C-methylase UbiE